MVQVVIYRGVSAITNNPNVFAQLDLKQPLSYWTEDKEKARSFTCGFGWILYSTIEENIINKYKKCSEKPRVYHITDDISYLLNIKTEEVINNEEVKKWRSIGFNVPDNLNFSMSDIQQFYIKRRF